MVSALACAAHSAKHFAAGRKSAINAVPMFAFTLAALSSVLLLCGYTLQLSTDAASANPAWKQHLGRILTAGRVLFVIASTSIVFVSIRRVDAIFGKRYRRPIMALLAIFCSCTAVHVITSIVESSGLAISFKLIDLSLIAYYLMAGLLDIIMSTTAFRYIVAVKRQVTRHNDDFFRRCTLAVRMLTGQLILFALGIASITTTIALQIEDTSTRLSLNASFTFMLVWYLELNHHVALCLKNIIRDGMHHLTCPAVHTGLTTAQETRRK